MGKAVVLLVLGLLAGYGVGVLVEGEGTGTAVDGLGNPDPGSESQRQPQPQPSPFVAPSAGPRTLMRYRDWSYLGSFTIPLVSRDGTRTAYGGWALTWMPDTSQDAGDGTPGVVVVRGHDHHQKILKLSIPSLSELRSASKREPTRTDYLGAYDTLALASAKPVGPFFDPTAGYRAKMSREVQDNVRLGGLAWIDGKLAYTLHRYFAAGGKTRWPGHGYQGSSTHWQLTVGGKVRSPQRTGGYICAAPKWWADAHLDGRRWLSGMITPQIHSSTNLGPGLYAFHPDEAKGDRVPATVLAEFPWSSRDPKVYPGASRCDYWRGVAFLDDGEKYGVFFIGSKGTPVEDKPFEGDDYGHGTDDPTKHRKPSGKDPFSWIFDRCDHTRGYHCYPYRAILLAFDPDEYVAVAEGAKKPWDVRHYEEIDFSKLLVDDCRYMVCGIGVDEASGLLYIGADWGHRDADRFEGTPAVHVWRWRRTE